MAVVPVRGDVQRLDIGYGCNSHAGEVRFVAQKRLIVRYDVASALGVDGDNIQTGAYHRRIMTKIQDSGKGIQINGLHVARRGEC